MKRHCFCSQSKLYLVEGVGFMGTGDLRLYALCPRRFRERAERAVQASELGIGGESNCVKYIVGVEHCSYQYNLI